MPTVNLTQIAVDRLKPPSTGRVEYFDRHLPAFGLRVSARGRKTWVVLYRVRGKLVRETLGTLVTIPKVDDARERARDSMRKAQAGIHPVKSRKVPKPGAGQGTDMLFSAAADLFLERYAKPNTRERTYYETQRIINRELKPAWGNWRVGEVTKRDVIDLLDGIIDRGAAIQANRTFAVIRRLGNWLFERELIERSPAAGLPMPAPARSRDRILSDTEIRLFWHACDQVGWPLGPLFQLLLLTAQRREETASMELSEIDFEKPRWTIPSEKAKNGNAHEVHLSPLALAILKGLPQIVPATRTNHSYLFTTSGLRPVSGFSHAKARVHAFMLEALRTEYARAGRDPDDAVIEEWVLHDLRRTATTGVAALGVAPHVADRILNHVSGTIRGVAAVYNRFAYLEERKAALEAWSRYIESLVGEGKDNIENVRDVFDQIERASRRNA